MSKTTKRWASILLVFARKFSHIAASEGPSIVADWGRNSSHIEATAVPFLMNIDGSNVPPAPLGFTRARLVLQRVAQAGVKNDDQLRFECLINQ
ncbi:MAG: hypothetical protein EA359_02470 [Balneolaceae bacterium]|nr:MAG: hypothetical protein EA359_02470 [Balneolaceae bacterium]